MYFGDFNWAVLAVFLLSAWVVLAGFRDFLDRHKGVLAGARSLTRSYWGATGAPGHRRVRHRHRPQQPVQRPA